MKKIFQILISMCCTIIGSMVVGIFLIFLSMLPAPFGFTVMAAIATVSIIVNIHQHEKIVRLTEVKDEN